MSDAFMNLSISGKEFKSTPGNTSLFTFIGEAAMYDHVFIAERQKDNRVTGMYLFKVIMEHNSPGVYQRMIEYMAREDYPMHLNMLKAPECDRKAYEQALGQIASAEAQEMPDSVPEDW